MTLKSITTAGWLKDVRDNFDVVRGAVAQVMAPPAAPATSVEITARYGLVIVPDDGAQTPGPIAMTLRDPDADEDGQILTIYSVVAEEHTVTLYGLDEAGDPAASAGFNGGDNDVATWDGGAGDVAIGDLLELVAYDGAWYVLRNTNVTLSASG